MAGDLRRAVDWGKLAPLRIVARSVADGVYAGGHRSARRGAGIEFGGQRSYVPGDDLRFIDRRALMRHGKLLVREFETETDRTLRLVVDASASMAWKSASAPCMKLAHAAVIAAALARVALSGGDPVALDWIGGTSARSLPSSGGREAFERIVGALESVEPGADLTHDTAAVELAIAPVGRRARRGALIVLLSDLLDLPPRSAELFAALGSHGRTPIAVQVLDPAEASFSFEGPVRLRASEGEALVETDATVARAGYLGALARLEQGWRDRLEPRGGRVVRTLTSETPLSAVVGVLRAAEGGSR